MGYQVIEYPHIQRRHKIVPAVARFKVIDVAIPPALTVGYIMGVGDQVPAALRQLGARVTLYPGVFVGADSRIGDDAVLYPNVVVREGCALGARVVVHSGTVIGADGFGYVQQ